MQPTITPQAFAAKWEQNTQKESATAKEHFADLCHLLGVPTPNDPGSGPDTYCFEKSLTKTGGKAGFADVWKKDCFAWEYKGKGRSATLDAAYTQLLLYKEDLGNPPVLIVCGIATYEVHIPFTGYRTRVERFTNADLANAGTRELLRLRDEWLAGQGVSDLPLNQRTLTNLYNRRPDWLDQAHKTLDLAVLDAYDWPHDLNDEDILARLLALNLERAAVRLPAPPPSLAEEME